jgi:hypothetical protein
LRKFFQVPKPDAISGRPYLPTQSAHEFQELHDLAANVFQCHAARQVDPE